MASAKPKAAHKGSQSKRRKPSKTERTIAFSWATLLKGLGAVLTLGIAAAGLWVSFQSQQAFLSVRLVPQDAAVLPKFKIYPEWKNSGNTPARDLQVKVVCIVSTQPLDRPEDHPKYRQSPWLRRVLGPQDTTYGGSCEFNSDHLSLAQQGVVSLYMLAAARYEDVFGEPHSTKYCARLTNISGDVHRTGKVRVSSDPCKTHNCFDDECKDN